MDWVTKQEGRGASIVLLYKKGKGGCLSHAEGGHKMF